MCEVRTLISHCFPSRFRDSREGRLIKCTVEGVRTRLDRIYLETLEEKNSGSSSRVSPGEVSSLQEEVESLYSEILPVAQMSVEQQFLEPALKKVEAKNGQEQAKSKQATGYVGGLDTAVGVLGLTAG